MDIDDDNDSCQLTTRIYLLPLILNGYDFITVIFICNPFVKYDIVNIKYHDAIFMLKLASYTIIG